MTILLLLLLVLLLLPVEEFRYSKDNFSNFLDQNLLQAECPSCHLGNSVKALKDKITKSPAVAEIADRTAWQHAFLGGGG